MSSHLKSLLTVALLAALGVGAYLLWEQSRSTLPPGLVFANGRLEATEADVASKLAGRLIALAPKEGDLVEAGAPVGRIDVADLVAQRAQTDALVMAATQAIAEAQAGVASAQSNRTLARATLKRSTELVERGFMSAQRLDADRAAVRAADAALHAATVRVEAARANETAAQAARQRLDVLVADGVLRAPVSGRVLYRLVEPGTVVAAGGKVLTVIDLSEVYMTVFLPADSAGTVKVGDEARLALDAWPDTPVPARVSFVADNSQFTPREVETRSEREKLMFRVKLSVTADWLAGHADAVKPGMAGVAWLRLEPSTPWPAHLAP
ncbi:MAG: HlyD family efflux transporter periplasmic adaptor subunit [Denitromonas halophila]|nr:MAG: HlyD family efflux transporter periplasmic adaptor subunit [Denitromonas halophila]TVT68102.1 MAG: HlyD family efflux transporter periplasmic adaptor subunit [Denitromonas halophila]